MSFLGVLLLAIALAVDAFVVSFSYGLIIVKKRTEASLKIAFAVGMGQFLMPVLGWYGAGSVYQYIEQLDHWIAFFVFLFLGLKIIGDSWRSCNCSKENNRKLGLRELFLIGVATSIDALVSGAMLYFVKMPVWSSAGIIGIVTFGASLVGFNLCYMFKRFSPQPLEVISGLILIGLGCKILLEHLSL